MLPLFAIILALKNTGMFFVFNFKDKSWKIANKVSLIKYMGWKEGCFFNKKLIFLFICTYMYREHAYTSHDESRRQSSELCTDTKYERGTRDSAFMNFPRDTKHIPCITVAIWLTREFAMLSFAINCPKLFGELKYSFYATL